MKCILILTLLVPELTFASPKKEALRIVDKDTTQGVETTIQKVTVNNQQYPVSQTGKNGYILKPFNCELLERVKILPFDSNYYQKEIRCPLVDKTVYLQSAEYELNLYANAQVSLDVGDFGSAAMAYTEMRARVKTNSAFNKTVIEKNAYDSAGKYFSVATATQFDPQQNKAVMSKELQSAIIEFQKSQGIKVTGKLDFKTLSTMSNKNLTELVFKKPQQLNGVAPKH